MGWNRKTKQEARKAVSRGRSLGLTPGLSVQLLLPCPLQILDPTATRFNPRLG